MNLLPVLSAFSPMSENLVSLIIALNTMAASLLILALTWEMHACNKYVEDEQHESNAFFFQVKVGRVF